MSVVEQIKKYVRAVNFLTIAQIYLQDNFLLDRSLVPEDIKPKLFGHWGTCPGINFVYANLQHLVKKHQQSTVFVLGLGHGFPGLQANLFVEGTLERYYPKATRDEKGIGYISKYFSWPYGFSSHSSPETPGLILEGGELGYSLATAYGAILDNPDLLAVCMIGDGEAETGPLAGAWHINKLIDPATNGAVLPILHLNGLKISGPTVFGRMSKEELRHLFDGYGYEPMFVGFGGEGGHMANSIWDMENIYEEMLEVMDAAYQKIRVIQNEVRGGGNPPLHPSNGREKRFRWPVIILKTPKGWTTVKELHGQAVEGTISSHQVVAPNARGDEEELAALEHWLKSYHFEELFDRRRGFDRDILDLIPSDDFLIGDNPHMFGREYKPLILPDSLTLAKNVNSLGEIVSNSMRMAGMYLKEVFALNEKQRNFRLMSPDETYSNRLDEVFQVTSRAFVWPHHDNDKDLSRDGRVMEMLSEHNMHGLAQGYVLAGRHAVFTTYEAFAQIFSSMAHMYQKFLKYVRSTKWREDIASMNYLLTSTAWRQEHNGYSHQNPSFISGMLEKHNDFIKVYFPPDDNSMLAVLDEMLASRNQMNVIVAGKTPEPRWLNLKQAKKELEQGLMVWDFASDDNPDVVLVGIGDYMTKEVLAAIELIKNDSPEVKLRFVNIMRLQAKCSCKDEYHPQISNAIRYFTKNKPVIVNFHGYPETMEAILFHMENPQRFSVHGYIEQGGTTTPFDMLVRNETDRYSLAIDIVDKLVAGGKWQVEKGHQLVEKYKRKLQEHHEYIVKNGVDPQEIEKWEWKGIQKSKVIGQKFERIFGDILKNDKTIAVIGLSDKPGRHSYRVAKYFQDQGFRIIPVNPNVSEVLGEKAYPDLLSIPKSVKIDVVDIFRRPSDVVAHLQEIVERGGIKSVWLQEGVNSREAEDFAEDYGLNMVTNFCIMEAYKRQGLGDSV